MLWRMVKPAPARLPVAGSAGAHLTGLASMGAARPVGKRVAGVPAVTGVRAAGARAAGQADA